MYKVNKYVSQYRDESDTIVFNALTGGLYKFNSYTAKMIAFDGAQDIERTIPRVTLDFLTKEQIVVPATLDEIEIVQARFRHARQYSKQLYATFILTEQCNLRCVYCYQNHQNTKASINSLQKSLRHVETRIDDYESLKVHWFGGEPLLRLDILEHTAFHLIKMCEERRKKYFSGITTNGILLNNRTAKKLKNLKVDQIQFTLDGDCDQHNELRVYASGNGTFFQVLSAIKIAVENNFITFVRVNLSKHNILSFERLLDRLILEGLGPDQIRLYINEMKEHGNSPPMSGLYFKDVAEYGTYLVDALSIMQRFGYPLPALVPVDVNCEFDKPSTMLFGTDGNMYHCTTGTDRPLALLDDEGEIKEKTERMCKTHDREPWDDPMCNNCKHLPLCMGGCSYLEEDGKTKCNPERFVLEPLIRLIAS